MKIRGPSTTYADMVKASAATVGAELCLSPAAATYGLWVLSSDAKTAIQHAKAANIAEYRILAAFVAGGREHRATVKQAIERRWKALQKEGWRA